MKPLITLIILLSSLFISISTAKTVRINTIKEINIESSINPATFNYIKSSIDGASLEKNELILIKMNTPGGLVSTTTDIISLIANSKAPVIIWITPEGATATSAGSIIASSAHILVASSGTSIGAATPISTSGDIQESDVRNKAINSLTSLVGSLSKTRGRNPDAFKEMIEKATSFDSEEALKKNVIDKIINSKADLIDYLNTLTLEFHNESIQLEASPNTEFQEISMDYGQAILNIFASPEFAYILFILGAALLYFEFQAPGGFIAGALGSFCLILAGIGFQVLPLNIGALGLILLAFILFVLEAYVTSYGIISIAGIISFVFGSLFLYRTDDSFLDTHYALIVSAALAIIAYLLIVGRLFFKKSSHKKYFDLSSQTGVISKILSEKDGDYKYQIKVSGEIWNAKASEKLYLGARVEVTKENKNKMLLTIKEIKL